MAGKAEVILGVSCSNHDRAAAIVIDGNLRMAIAEERVDRRKLSDGAFALDPRDCVVPPIRAASYVLSAAGLSLADVNLIVCGRSIESCRPTVQSWLGGLTSAPIIEPSSPGHHLAHAYAAFSTCPWPEAAVLVVDERGSRLLDGSFECVSIFHAAGNRVVPVISYGCTSDQISLGSAYAFFAAFLGMREAGYSSAGKLMGLAAYGRSHPEWPSLFDQEQQRTPATISIEAILRLLKCIGFDAGWAPGVPSLPVSSSGLTSSDQLARDLAYHVQKHLEEAIVLLAREAISKTGAKNLCYSGGVALNCLANSRLNESGCDDAFIMPAAGDDGTAIGLAYFGHFSLRESAYHKPSLFSPFLGRTYSRPYVNGALEHYGIRDYADSTDSIERVASAVAEGKVICWFDGPGEFGPRALGARSIVANPLSQGIKERINANIKARESFRPFGVSGCDPDLDALFELGKVSKSLFPYMLVTVKAKLPSPLEVIHADGTCRVQRLTPGISSQAWSRLHQLVGESTGHQLLINTSFNCFGEPVAETPLDAVRLFCLSLTDGLYIDGTYISRESIPLIVRTHMCAKAVEDTAIDWPSKLLTLHKRGYKELANHVMRSAPSVTDCLLSTEVNKIRLRIAGRSAVNSEELCDFLEQAYEAVTLSADLNELAGDLGRFVNGTSSESFQLGLLRAVSSRAGLRSLRVALQTKNRDDSFRGSK